MNFKQYLLLILGLFCIFSLAMAQDEIPSNSDADEPDSIDNPNAQSPIPDTKKTQEIFDEICSTIGTCYRDNAAGYEECLNSCADVDCYACKGLTVRARCCLKF